MHLLSLVDWQRKYHVKIAMNTYESWVMKLCHLSLVSKVNRIMCLLQSKLSGSLECPKVDAILLRRVPECQHE